MNGSDLFVALSPAVGPSEMVWKLPHFGAMRRVCLCVADNSLQLVDRVRLPRLKLRSSGFAAVVEVRFDRHPGRGVEPDALAGEARDGAGDAAPMGEGLGVVGVLLAPAGFGIGGESVLGNERSRSAQTRTPAKGRSRLIRIAADPR